MSGLTVLVLVESVLLVALLVLVAGLLRSHADILRALHELGLGLDPAASDGSGTAAAVDLGRRRPLPRTGASGRPAPDVVGTTPTGAAVVVSTAGPPGFTLLAFLTSGCTTCRGFWDAFRDPGLSVPAGARLVIVTKGQDSESPAAVFGLEPGRATTVMSSAAWSDYQVPATPYFVLVDRSRAAVTGEGTAPTWPAVADLIRRVLADAGHADAFAGHEAVPVDEALRAAGIGPGHPSLTPPVAGTGNGTDGRSE